MELITEIRGDIRNAAQAILKQPRVLLLPAAALAQGLLLNGLVMTAAWNCVAIKQAANYVAFLITLS
jgi:hypothetical protein